MFPILKMLVFTEKHLQRYKSYILNDQGITDG